MGPKQAFTLIELLVVIAIIGLLSSVVLGSVSKARERAQDARRREDLQQAATALSLYYHNNGNWIEVGSGCGASGNGIGWFNYQGTSYPKSIAQCLVDAGLTPAPIIDPTGGTTSSPTSRFAYMKYHCTQSGKKVAYLLAKMASLPQSSTAVDATCCSSCDSSYGMNYYVKVE